MGRSRVTHLLDSWTAGDASALQQLMPLIVGDLRRIAARQLSEEKPGHTLQPTALVNEIYIKLKGKRSVSWHSRAQFFASVAGIMRRLLVDHARGHLAKKRGGGELILLSLEEDFQQASENPKNPNLVALDEALVQLAELDPRQARIVEMRYFTGLTVNEIAAVEEISATTVKREWRTARLWLMREMQGP